jgi:alpha-N-acetylglucosamine transferase
LIVLATDSLGTAHRELISRRGIEVVGIQHLAPAAGAHGGFDDKFARFHDTWTKLQVFGVPGYDRLVLIDADTIMLRGMDELFDLPLAEDEIAAAPACTCNPFKFAHYPPDWVPANCSLSRQPRPTTLDNVPQPTPDAPRTAHLLNSGVVVLRPSTGLMETLVTHLNTSPTLADVQFPDQDVLADVFRGKWRVLPWWANSLKTERAVHKNIWEDSEVRLLHYILDKPWDRRPATSTAAAVANAPTDQLPPALITAVRKASPQESMTDYDELHSWWWAVYDQLIAEIKADGSADWEEVDRFVAH